MKKRYCGGMIAVIQIQNDFIRSERLLMRPLSIEDAEDMFDFTRLPESSAFLQWKPHISVEEDTCFIQNALQDKDSLYWGIQHLTMGNLIGNIHVYDLQIKNLRAEISYILHPKFAGRGFATEAVRAVIQYLFEHGLNRIQALCVDGNDRSEKLMLRCGMSYEGTLRSYAWVRNKACDMKMYSICKAD